MSATAVLHQRDHQLAALKSGFFLLDSCIKVDSSEVSNWAVIVNSYPLRRKQKDTPFRGHCQVNWDKNQKEEQCDC